MNIGYKINCDLTWIQKEIIPGWNVKCEVYITPSAGSL